MDKAVAQFSLEDGTTFLAEVDESDSGSIQRVSIERTGELVYKAEQTLESALDNIKPVASTIVSKMREIANPADGVEVTFGLKLSAEAGIIFSSVGSEVTFEVKLKWEGK